MKINLDTLKNIDRNYKYDTTKGWFYNEPEWHEAVVKYSSSIHDCEQLLMICSMMEMVGESLEEVIWYSSGNHFKVKFKDQTIRDNFLVRWSNDWQPRRDDMTYCIDAIEIYSDFFHLFEQLNDKVGEIGVDWDYGYTGIWFKDRISSTFIRLSLGRNSRNRIHSKWPLHNKSSKKNKIFTVIHRPISKSVVLQKHNKKIELTYCFELSEIEFDSPFLSTKFFSKYGTICRWCTENIKTGRWYCDLQHVYFANDKDYVLFLLRWA